MAYDRTYWLDHVVDQHGAVIQEGTLLDQNHFNNAERGISDTNLAWAITQWAQTQDNYNLEGEKHVLNLAMNAGMPFPFNNAETTIALTILRENTDYSVECDVLEYSGGQLGNIRVVDRARNGFKLVHDGSATNVRVAVRVSGGMIGPVAMLGHHTSNKYT